MRLFLHDDSTVSKKKEDETRRPALYLRRVDMIVYSLEQDD